LFVIISLVPDSFAGERERHTLETLLASRMPDRPILLGKVAMVVLYSWGMLVVALLLGAGIYNLAYGEHQPAFYPLDLLLLTLLLGVLVGTLGASAGVLLSLRISTVRQAQQTLMIGTLVLGGALIALLQVLPKAFFQLPPDEIWLIVAGVVALLDSVLLAFMLARFQRAKLILS